MEQGLKFVALFGVSSLALMLGACQGADHPEAMGKSVEQAILRKDAAELASFIPERELTQYGISRDTARKMIQAELFDRWSPIQSQVEFLPAGGTGSVSLRLSTKDGQESNFGLSVVPTDSGTEVSQILMNIVLMNATAQGRKEGKSSAAGDRPLLWRDYIVAESGRLEKSYGIRGLVFTRETGLVTWANLVKQFEERAAKVRAAQGLSPPGR